MLFLKDILQPRPTKSSLDDDNLDESNDSENITENNEHDTVDHINNDKNDKINDNACFKRPTSEFIICNEEMPQTKKPKTKKKLTMEDENPGKMTDFERHMITLESQKLQMLQGSGDEDLNFFKSLLPYIKKLPDLSKMNVRIQMQNIVFQEYTKVLEMNERCLAVNNNTNIRPVSNYSSTSSSEISPVPSPVSSSATHRYYEFHTGEQTDNTYYGNSTDNWPQNI